MNNLGGIQKGSEITNINNSQQNEKLSLSDKITYSQIEAASAEEAEVRKMAEKVHTNTANIEQLSQIASKLQNINHSVSVKNVHESHSWSVTGDTFPKTIHLDNGYKLTIHDNKSKWEISDANNNVTTIWGDPHVSENDRDGYWDFHADSSFILPDGTKITVGTNPGKLTNGYVYSDTLTITKGHQSISVSGLAQNKPAIGEPSFNGVALDAQTNDGHAFHAGDNTADWIYNGAEITGSAKIMDKKHSEMGSSGQAAPANILETLLSPQDITLLKELGVTIYDASGVGKLTDTEVQNVLDQISNAKETLKSISNLDMVKLQAQTGKAQQHYSMASQTMKTLFNTVREIIRNTA